MCRGYSCDVQFGQRVALSGMLDRQYLHSLVVGAAGAGSFFMRLICRTSFTVFPCSPYLWLNLGMQALFTLRGVSRWLA